LSAQCILLESKKGQPIWGLFKNKIKVKTHRSVPHFPWVTKVTPGNTKAFAKLYYGKVDMLDLPADVKENFLVFDSSDQTKFSRPLLMR